MNKKVIILLCSLLCAFIVFYFIFMHDSNKKNSNTNTVETITYEEKNTDFSKYDETTINLSNEKDVYTITSGGVYHFTGTYSSYIKVDTEDNVKIILDNVTINNSNGPCIYGVNSKNIYIELVGENTLTDGSSYSNLDEEVKAVIFSNDDLIFSGSGSLVINANYNDGISSDDDIEFISGTYTIKSKDDGIRGKDSVVIVSGNFTIDAGGDGIKSTNDTDEGKGYVLIKDGKINITSENDGIDAIDVEIDNGVITVKSGGGAPTLSVKTGFNNSNSTSESQKGIKADNNILIKDGTISVNSYDDGIHSNNTIQIDNGKITISTGDDGVHADGLIEINGGTFEISGAEGIEATYVKINDGTINISASDDGINAGNKSSNYKTTVEINGGNITIKMGAGDTDGIDSNGNLYINGGTINITGNSPFDYDGEAKYNGGTLIVNGQTTNTITNQFGGGMQGNRNMQNNNMPNDRRMNRNMSNDGTTPTGGNMNGRGRI